MLSIIFVWLGIAHLFGVYESSPNYTNEEGQMDVADQLAAVWITLGFKTIIIPKSKPDKQKNKQRAKEKCHWFS